MGNFEIQAKIDIERHPEWDYNTKRWHLSNGRMKDNLQRRKDCHNQIWITTGWRHVTDADHYVPFTITYDEPHWYDARPIPIYTRTGVLGDVRI